MKRFIALILVALMLVPAFVSCKESEPLAFDETDAPATEPPVTEPPATEPPVTEPPATEPPVTEPPATEPPATEPPVTEPPATEPPATEPPVTEPPATEPPVTEPPATEPPVTKPPVTEPPATEPPVTEPPATEPPVTEPPATEPPVTEPPVTEPSVTEPPVTEPPVTEPPVTEPPVTEPPVTEPPVTEPPAEELSYKFYENWKAPSSYYKKTENDYVSAIVSNNLNSVFITARKSGELCWYFAVSDNEIPSSTPFLSVSTTVATPLVKYKSFKDGFEKINYEKNSIAIKAGQTVKVDLDGYQSVVVAIKDNKGMYSEWMTVRNPGIDLELAANMDSEGIRYADIALNNIGQKGYFKFSAKADGIVYARVICVPNSKNSVTSIPTVSTQEPYFKSYSIGKGAQLTFDYVKVRKDGNYNLNLSYTIEFYRTLFGLGNLMTNVSQQTLIPDTLYAREMDEAKRKKLTESLYLCIQLVDGENFYQPIVIRFDELIEE